MKNNADDCVDIDECLGTNDCHDSASCVNEAGSYSCYCNTGFHGNGTSCYEGNCDDNLCKTNEHCPSSTSFCDCKAGFRRDEDSCIDIDECSDSSIKCDINAECVNTPGSFSCNCKSGFYGDGFFCVAGRCHDTNCPTKQTCISATSNKCKCIKTNNVIK